MEPRFDGTTRLPDRFREVVVSVVGELRQDAVTRPEQFLQMIGFVHDANLAALRLSKTLTLVQVQSRTRERPIKKKFGSVCAGGSGPPRPRSSRVSGGAAKIPKEDAQQVDA